MLTFHGTQPSPELHPLFFALRGTIRGRYAYLPMPCRLKLCSVDNPSAFLPRSFSSLDLLPSKPCQVEFLGGSFLGRTIAFFQIPPFFLSHISEPRFAFPCYFSSTEFTKHALQRRPFLLRGRCDVLLPKPISALAPHPHRLFSFVLSILSVSSPSFLLTI